MSIRDLLKPKAKAEILKSLEKNSLDPQLLQLITDSDEAYEVLMGAISMMNGDAKEIIQRINSLLKVFKRLV